MTEEPTLDEIPYQSPDREALERAAAGFLEALRAAGSAQAQIAVIRDWDRHEAQVDTWRNLAMIQWARDLEQEAEKTLWDQIDPDREGWQVDFLRVVLGSPHREALSDALGAQALALWEVKVSSFDPAIADLKRRESELSTRYSRILAEARVDFQGEPTRLSDLRGSFGHADRAVRQACREAQDRLLAGLKDELDSLYDQLVEVRQQTAQVLGEGSFTPVGYRRMGRTDYGPEQVAVFREQLHQHLVPLCAAIHERRAQSLGIDHVALHDEPVRDLQGVPRPMGGHDWMVERGRELFHALGSDFGDFYELLQRRELMDLESRAGKVGGGFCESLPSQEVPFIFANFNGTQDDVNVFTHECGHAFQAWSSRKAPLRDYLWPTYEACEIHSMGLEFLTYGQMELFFGDDAERFRQGHLEDGLLFLPYGALVDEFQHEVYANPDLDADGRAALWLRLERKWLPWRRYDGDYPHFASGRMWQRQQHIYNSPFYYIDYCLAQVCAMQLWDRYVQDPEATLRTYRDLCDLGGTLPFTGLLDAVGLASPFEEGTVERVVTRARTFLGL